MSKPSKFYYESRKGIDGHFFIGHNKFDETGVQINDFVLECDEKKTKQVPERLRGRHTKISYNIEMGCYTIQDLGAGQGTF